MTTPRLTGTRPDTARNSAIVALLAQNPDGTVLAEEVLRTDDNTQRGVSARLLSFKRRNPGFSVWTRSEDDGYVRGYVKRSQPAITAQKLSSTSVTSDTLTALAMKIESIQPSPRLESSSVKSSKPAKAGSPAYLNRLLNPLPSNTARNGTWTNLTTRRNKSGVAGYDRKNPDVLSVERRRIALINYAKAHGVTIKTRVIATEKTVRLEARVVPA